MALVLHRSHDSGDALLRTIRRISARQVVEPVDKESVQDGVLYVAPAGYHMMVEDGSFALSTSGPVEYARPSIDVLFESAADSYGPEVIGVVLTGSNSDGALGARAIRGRGGYVIAQQPESAVSPEMPAAAIAAGGADAIVPLDKIARLLDEMCC